MGGTLLYYLLFFTSALTLIVQTQCTPVLFKYIFISVGDNKEVITGRSTVILDGRTIANITIGQLNNDAIKVDGGGVGLGDVSFDLNFEVSTQSAFYIAVYADDDVAQEDVNDIEEYVTKLENRQMKTIEDGTIMTITDFGVFSSQNVARNESTSYTFDNDVVWNCNGLSDWDGKGTTDVIGGIAENYIKVKHQIPAGLTGSTLLKCEYVEDHLMKRELQPEVRNVDEDQQRYAQFFGSVIPGTFGLVWSAMTPANIVQVDGGVTWKNGDGTVVMDGGVGTDYVAVSRDNDTATSYGTFYYEISYIHFNATTTAGN